MSDEGMKDKYTHMKCTLADLELSDCYHMSPNSMKTTLIVRFCLGDFKSCEIYKMQAGKASE